MTSSPNTPPPTALAKRRRWRTWLVALLIFAGGALFGGALTLIVTVRVVQNALQHPEQAPARITQRLTRRLDLSTDQATRIEQIIARRQLALQDIRAEIEPRVRTQIGELEREISEVLTPEQQVRWNAMMTNLRENWLPKE